MRGIQAFTAVGVLVLALAGCGGGERQDANEPSGTYKLQVVDASFPQKQSIAEASTFKITVRNADTKRVPNVAVTLETNAPTSGGSPQAFAQSVADPNLADSSRPVWILDKGPVGGDTAYTNTWALGALDAGKTQTFEWHVTAVKPGDYTIKYTVSPGLNGKARTEGDNAKGSLDVKIDDKPPSARVGDNGEVIRQQ